ncbi:MAG: hypothetical protein RIQ33_79 [Bacteroidota bacterium]
MKKIYFVLLLAFAMNAANAQSAGDTILINTFNYSQTYGSGIRDTMIDFPNLSGVTFEKIFMLYNMRCKNNLVSTSTQRSLGCGEWDYSCNTYITDSSKVDSVKATSPTHIIKGFKGSVYPYTFQPTYTYYQYAQKNVIHHSVITEFDTTIGIGNKTSTAPFQALKQRAKSQFLWSATELLSVGLVAGNISSIKLNVTNANASAQFLRIKMKHTAKTNLSAVTPDLTGFTEVYFLNTTLVAGLNEFNFYNNFNWNGTDNIIVEFSFENTMLGNSSIVAADSLTQIKGIISEGKDYSIEFTGANFAQLGNSNFSNFSDQISISFWCNGNGQILPTNTSIMYATNPSNDRQVNIHLPWSNSSVFWDCGSGGNYDRINKTANFTDFANQWNHWTFTKNKTTGSMKIYLNGLLWHSGTGKNVPIQITDFMIGSGPNLVNPYFGKIDDFSIWNTELSASTIQAWMHQSITSSHPNFNNLIAHYNFNEGIGLIAADSSSIHTSANLIGNPIWRKDNANNIFKNFTETNIRPTLTFVQGTYNQSINTIVVVDSIINNTNTVYSYHVVNHAALPYDTTTSYAAGYVYKYDGNTGFKIDSIFIPAINTITIGTLNYFKIFPSRFQIMSFVTPYGIGLDLGANGKTWTFDVTDLTPILKGKKRMTIDAGGQWQEDLNIKFMYIVGTPPHDVKDISNIWKVDNSDYTGILNDNYFEPRTIHLAANASAFKIRTAITGHGQDGEFIPRKHFLNINGGIKEFSWNVWKPCANNPIYPQGGTWIYDRAGWCPGAPTDLKETDITQFVTPGSSALIDYGIDTVSGQSNYWVSSELVSYGAPNFTTDAAVIDIQSPSKKTEYMRINTICNNPTITIKNTGSTALTSVIIEYWINNNSAKKESYTWLGNLAFNQQIDVVLPTSGNLWSGITGLTNNIFNVEIKSPNASTDGYLFNNKMKSTFDIPPVLPADITIWFKTNTAANESSFKLFDATGAIVFQRNGMSNNTNYFDDVTLSPGCYSFVMEDTDDDGFDFWANSDGVGICQLKDIDGNLLKKFSGDFGKSLVFNFTVDYPLSYQQINAFKNSELSIYPNPASQSIVISHQSLVNTIEIMDVLGRRLKTISNIQLSISNIQVNELPNGIYFIKATDINGNVSNEKFVKE